MPKMLETYNPFGGGINSKDDARDIAKNELVDCLNIMVDSVGKVRTSPTVSTVKAAHTVNFEREATGLFTWSADADWDDDSWQGDTASPKEFIVFYNSGDARVHMYPQRDHANFMEISGYGDGSSHVYVDMGTNTTGGSPIYGNSTFYAADNALRVLNANFRENLALSGQWFGFIDRKYFQYSSGNFMMDTSPDGSTEGRWYQDNNNLPAPGRGVWSEHVVGTADSGGNTLDLNIVGDDLQATVATEFNSEPYYVIDTADTDHLCKTAGAGSTSALIKIDASTANEQSWASRAFSVHPPDGKGFCVDINLTSSTDSMWKNGKYEIGQSFVYMGGQESNVAKLIGGNLTIAEDEYPTFTVTGTAGAIAPGASPATGYHPRIIGGRIYTRRADTGAPWRLAVDLSFERGSRMSLGHTFDYWNYHASSGLAISNLHFVYTDSYEAKAPSADTFQTINGYDSEQPGHTMGTSGWGAKCAVVANQRVFLGNVKYKDEAGTEAVHSDRVLYSPIGKYDLFPTNHYIDIGLGDGDDIVNMIETSDRLLVFKKKNLYIINIGSGSDAGWFIEGTYPYKGIANRAAAFKSDTGCVWANNNGCYIFDGRQVTDLTEKLDDKIWSDFIGTGRIVVGYVPSKHQVIVVKNAAMASSGDNEAYIYDIRTRSWVRNDSLFAQASNRAITNFAIYNNDLIYAVESSGTQSVTTKIDVVSGSHKVQFVTRDEDFGQPSLKKKFYKIYVNYRNNEGSDQHLECRYSNNGANAGTTATAAASAYTLFSSTRATLESDNEWHIATFEASTPISGQSISLYFATTDGASSSTLEATNIEINEVTIEWRPLRQRAST